MAAGCLAVAIPVFAQVKDNQVTAVENQSVNVFKSMTEWAILDDAGKAMQAAAQGFAAAGFDVLGAEVFQDPVPPYQFRYRIKCSARGDQAKQGKVITYSPEGSWALESSAKKAMETTAAIYKSSARRVITTELYKTYRERYIFRVVILELPGLKAVTELPKGEFIETTNGGFVINF